MSHRHVVLELVQKHKWTKGVELGVASGLLFGLLLRECPDLHLVGFDWMRRADRAAKIHQLVVKYHPRAACHKMATADGASLMEPHSLDFAFIDADHRYAGVKADIQAWTSRIRPGGMLLGHDYNRGRFPGVIKAVDEAFGERVMELEHNVWGVQL